MMFEKYRAILAATDWHTDEKMLRAPLQDWLLHTDSLTQKLQQICPHLRVEILREGWAQSANFAGNPTACWLREVQLYCGDKPWIFAQTLLPKQTIEQVAQAVPTLGEQPIGLWLFAQNPERLSLEWRQDRETGLYARRSRLRVKGYELEIRELFLPDFLQNFR